MSWSAVCANASAASARRWSRVKPPAASAASTSAYREGSVTTATEPWFLAGGRGQAGGVRGGRGEGGAGAVVLGGGPDHGRAADVDLLHALLRRGAGRHRGL